MGIRFKPTSHTSEFGEEYFQSDSDKKFPSNSFCMQNSVGGKSQPTYGNHIRFPKQEVV